MMPPAKDKDLKSFSRLNDRINAAVLESRRVFISDAVDNVTASEVIRQLWYLELMDAKKPILLVINSPGGSVDSGFAIWDQVKMISCPVMTLVTGLAASMGSILSLCATNGMRFSTPEARIMIHQPLISGVVRGQATDLDIQAKEILKTREKLVQIYVDHTGKTTEEIARAIDRDTWFSAKEAMEFGLIKGIVKSFNDIKEI